MVKVRQIKNVLRRGLDNKLKQRRKIGLYSAIGLIDFSFISIYQIGVINKLPDLPWKIFDSNKVNASRHAYRMGLPDATVSAGIYAFNLMLLSYKGTKSTGRPKIADYALAAAVLANAGGAAIYLLNMVRQQKKACPYCILGAALNFASIQPVLKLFK